MENRKKERGGGEVGARGGGRAPERCLCFSRARKGRCVGRGASRTHTPQSWWMGEGPDTACGWVGWWGRAGRVRAGGRANPVFFFFSPGRKNERGGGGSGLLRCARTRGDTRPAPHIPHPPRVHQVAGPPAEWAGVRAGRWQGAGGAVRTRPRPRLRLPSARPISPRVLFFSLACALSRCLGSLHHAPGDQRRAGVRLAPSADRAGQRGWVRRDRIMRRGGRSRPHGRTKKEWGRGVLESGRCHHFVTPFPRLRV